MKRFLINISKNNNYLLFLNNNSNKLFTNNNNLLRNFITISNNNNNQLQPQQQQQQFTTKSINQLFNNNNNNNNNKINKNHRYYCKTPINNENNGVTDAEVDVHREDDDPNGEFRAIDANGIKIEPKYYIEFTCTYVDPSGDGSECGHVSRKTFSKHAYHKGVVLIRCDGCKKIHTIADNLGWTGYDNAKNIEEIMAEKGETIRKYLLKGEKLFPHGEGETENSTSSDGPILIGGANNNENTLNDKNQKK